MLFAVVSHAFLARARAFGWMKGESGRMRFGWICERSVELNCYFKDQEHIHGYWRDEMGLRAEFITILWEMVGSRTGTFLRQRSGA